MELDKTDMTNHDNDSRKINKIPIKVTRRHSPRFAYKQTRAKILC